MMSPLIHPSLMLFDSSIADAIQTATPLGEDAQDAVPEWMEQSSMSLVIKFLMMTRS